MVNYKEEWFLWKLTEQKLNIFEDIAKFKLDTGYEFTIKDMAKLRKAYVIHRTENKNNIVKALRLFLADTQEVIL